jgi:hypothetical protein
LRHALALAAATLCLGGLGGLADPAHAEQARLDTPRSHRAEAGLALSAPSAAPAASVVGDFLRSRGRDADSVAGLVVRGEGRGKGGLRHVRLEQTVDGVAVHGSQIKAAVSSRGELVQLSERTFALGGPRVRASIVERQALQAALDRLHPGGAAGSLGAASVTGHTTRFSPAAGNSFFHGEPSVTSVYIPQADGSLAAGFLVETWTQKGNQLHHTLVDGQGQVVSVESRTANDSYNVFRIDPAKTPQAVVAGPGTTGNAQSPSGWLTTAAQTTVNIKGNNINAYLDTDSNNRADTGGTAVTTGNFTTAASLTTTPTGTANRAVAVQNLFYLNNVVHDRLYRHGFDEANGNFQINNFAKGGLGNDAVLAEAQDGGGTDNANFATPSDGQAPRMQMYLWTGAGATHEVVVGSTIYPAMGAQFGSTLTTTGITGAVILANDGVGTTSDACEPLPAAVRGRVVLADRGTCAFTVKLQNAQAARATGLIVANNDASAIFTMGGTATGLRIPAVMVSQAHGATLRALASPTATLRRKAVQPLQIDGDLDSDIVYHEYGHGLTWRMIGSMSGPLAGAIGEGASDVVAFLMNGDDVVGEYSASNPLGIRRFRYLNYPLTYADVTGAEVHNDGEIYAGAMWRLRDAYLANGLTIDNLFDDFVDGMNFTPAAPAFEHMRNGMLDSINADTVLTAAQKTTRCTLVWQAFAQSGIGDGARGTVLTTTSVSIVPSFTSRTNCTH